MTKKSAIIFLILPISLIFSLCSLQKPTEIDGTASARFVVVDTSGTLSLDSLSNYAVVPHANVRMNSLDYAIPLRFESDVNGIVEIHNERAAYCRVSVEKYLDADYLTSLGKEPRTVMLSGSIEIDLAPRKNTPTDTIKVGVSYLSSIVINEIYYACPANSGLYFSDQYIELYNASDSVQYLDQLLVCRLSSTQEYPDQIKAIRYFQFPGSGKEYPFEPGQFVVIAQDAIDHVNVGGAVGSIDLSNADWEFYNQFYPDLDNPDVPNVLNASPVSGGWDFMINLSSDEICIIRVDDLDAVPFYKGSYKLFSIFDIIDGVEYSPNPDHVKALDPRIDAGLAGYTIRSYSGRSIERHHPVTGAPGYDTNNSTFDFVSLYHPTPGGQHTQEDIIPPK